MYHKSRFSLIDSSGMSICAFLSSYKKLKEEERHCVCVWYLFIIWSEHFGDNMITLFHWLYAAQFQLAYKIDIKWDSIFLLILFTLHGANDTFFDITSIPNIDKHQGSSKLSHTFLSDQLPWTLDNVHWTWWCSPSFTVFFVSYEWTCGGHFSLSSIVEMKNEDKRSCGKSVKDNLLSASIGLWI